MKNLTIKQIVGLLRHIKKDNWLLVTVDGYVISAYWCEYNGQYADILNDTERIVGYFDRSIKMNNLREMIYNARRCSNG